MKHLVARLLRPAARTRNRPALPARPSLAWLGLGRHRPGPTAGPRPRRNGRAAGGGTGRRDPAAAFERLVALYTNASTLRDCALVETRVGEDALSYGDELRATQHFDYSRHYRLRADETEASIRHELARLRRERNDWERLSAAALTRARQRLYGADDLSGRPQFD